MDNSGSLRILIAAEIFPPTIGGPATHLEILIPKLISRGHSVTVVTFSDVEIINTFGATVVRIPLYKSFAKRWIVYTLKLFKLARRGQAIYVLGTVLAGLPSFIVSKLKGIPYILRIPGDYIWEYVRRHQQNVTIEGVYQKAFGMHATMFKIIQRSVVNSAAHVYATSKAQVDLTKYWKIKKDVDVVYSPVLQKNGIHTQRENRIIATGRLVSVKGFDVLLHDIHDWLTKHPEWTLAIYGEGPEKEYLESILRELGMEAQVTIHDAVSQKQLAAEYAKSRIAIIYSEYDALPHSLFEAIGHNISVIATRVGGIPEILEGYPYGHLLVDRNSQELDAALDASLFDTIDVAATIPPELSPEHMTETIISLLAEHSRL